MKFGLLFLIYIVVGVLVAGGIIGNEDSYFSSLNNLEEIIEMILAVLLWPLVLLDVNINIGDVGDDGSGGGGSEAPAEGGSGGESSGGESSGGGGGGGK